MEYGSIFYLLPQVSVTCLPTQPPCTGVWMQMSSVDGYVTWHVMEYYGRR
jgi:hypothetical protein